MQEKSKLRYIILIYIFHIEIQLYIETELLDRLKYIYLSTRSLPKSNYATSVYLGLFSIVRLMICLTKRSLANHINQF